MNLPWQAVDHALLSVVVAVYNEEGNVAPLANEIVVALRGATRFELIFVDDSSSDGTRSVLESMKTSIPELRSVRHAANYGQSAAVRSGVVEAKGAWVVTLDGDGQNDPVDIPKLLERRTAASGRVKLFAGWRVQRKDSLSKRLASRVANAIRGRLLNDGTPDTGCGIKLFEREAFLSLPYFDHMHRFLPALMQRAGWQTVSVPVSHRPRVRGASKYNNLGRAIVGVSDLLGVAWLMRRSRVVHLEQNQDLQPTDQYGATAQLREHPRHAPACRTVGAQHLMRNE